jgi:hypothetical protein
LGRVYTCFEPRLHWFWAGFCTNFNFFKKKILYFLGLLPFSTKLTNQNTKLQIQNTKAQTNNHITKSKYNFTNPNNQIQNRKITNPNNHIGIPNSKTKQIHILQIPKPNKAK